MKLNHVSASQVKDFRGCARLWFFKNVVKKRPPQTVAQAKGTLIHAALEAQLKGQKLDSIKLPEGVTPEEILKYLNVLRPIIDRDGPVGLVEHKAEISTFPDGPKFVLVVDHAREIQHETYGPLPQIDDLKTTSDFRYCKTPEELATDAQMVSYAKWALQLFVESSRPLPDFVSVRHVYVRTKGKTIAAERSRLLSPEEIEEQWQLVLADVRAMLGLAEKTEDPMKVMPNTGYCSAFGGCYFQPDCGTTQNTIDQAFEKAERNKSMSEVTTKRPSLMDRIREIDAKYGNKPADVPEAAPAVAAVAASPTPASPKLSRLARLRGEEAPPPAAVVSDIPHVLPPEAPDRASLAEPPPVAATVPPPVPAEAVSTSPAAEPPAAAPKRRGRPPNAKPVVVPETPALALSEAPVAEPPPPPPPVVVALEKPVVLPLIENVCKLEELYVDCIPTKGSEFCFADAILANAGSAAAKNENVADWRLINYTSRGNLAVAIRAQLSEMPQTLVVMSSQSGSDVLIEVLAPIARKVVRALRG